jgi:hypothetical protein
MNQPFVDHPPHYQGKSMETIEVIESFDLNFCLGNAIKYILRAGKKGDKEEDLRKAIWYLEREIQNECNLPVKSSAYYYSDEITIMRKDTDVLD